jgi:hypothetical protein
MGHILVRVNQIWKVPLGAVPLVEQPSDVILWVIIGVIATDCDPWDRRELMGESSYFSLDPLNVGTMIATEKYNTDGTVTELREWLGNPLQIRKTYRWGTRNFVVSWLDWHLIPPNNRKFGDLLSLGTTWSNLLRHRLLN